MTYHEMEERLKVRLEECLKEVRMKNKENVLVPIEIKTGELPPRNVVPTGTKEFPYVLIRPYKGEDTAEESTVTVILLLGIIAGNEKPANKMPANKIDTMELHNYENAHKDLMRMIQIIRRSVLSNDILGENFSFKKQFKWQIYLEQPYPYMYADIELLIKVPQVEFEIMEDEF